MSEYICSGRGFTYEGCSDCHGLRRVIAGSIPKSGIHPRIPCDCSPRWVLFTKRTEDPKLAWIEGQLQKLGIPSRRNGASFHAPILEVPEEHHQAADAWLQTPVDAHENGDNRTIDDVDDDDPMFL